MADEQHKDFLGYAVFFRDDALQALGDAITPYLRDSPRGRHVQCQEIDTGGAFVEMLLKRASREGRWTQIELMVPAGMIRMIVSVQSDETFGFGPREAEVAALLPPASPGGTLPAAQPAAPDGRQSPTASGREPPEG